MRYVVTKVEGWEIRPVIREQGRLPGLTMHVLDTAWNHHIVAMFRSERVPGLVNATRAVKWGTIRARADALAARLNEADAASRVDG